jgi:nicotinamidase-related amidase
MADGTYTAHRTALLVVDPYNDFMTEGGKLFNVIKETADASGMFGNLRKILPRVRSEIVETAARRSDTRHQHHLNTGRWAKTAFSANVHFGSCHEQQRSTR